MELLAGVWDMNAELVIFLTIFYKIKYFFIKDIIYFYIYIGLQKESNCTFQFDFSKVYWNSRLQGEHERLVKKFKKNEFICMFNYLIKLNWIKLLLFFFFSFL